VLFLVSTFSFVLDIQPVNGNETVNQTIYINADGTVDPPTVPIQRNGDLYTLTSNITIDAHPGIRIMKDNVTLDGAGFTIQYPVRGTPEYFPATGIYLHEVKNVTVKNVGLANYYYEGILLDGKSVNNRMIRNNIFFRGLGIRFEKEASNNSLIGNTIWGGYRYMQGAILVRSSSNYLYENRIAFSSIFSAYFGISFTDNSSFNAIVRNDLHTPVLL